MNAVSQLIRPRTLANVLLDIAREQQIVKEATERFYAFEAQGNIDEANRQGDIEALADSCLIDLREEARDMIEAVTGCQWASIEGAGL